MQELKSWSHFFDAIMRGEKRHDLRSLKDRDYKIGEVVRLKRYDNIKGEYTGQHLDVKITYITSRNTPCAYSSAVLDNDYAILSIEPVNKAEGRTHEAQDDLRYDPHRRCGGWVYG